MLRSSEAAAAVALGEPAFAAGELQQEQDEAQELAGGADAAGQDAVEPVGWVADEAGQHDGADLDAALSPFPEASRRTRKGVISSTSDELPAMIEAHSE